MLIQLISLSDLAWMQKQSFIHDSTQLLQTGCSGDVSWNLEEWQEGGGRGEKYLLHPSSQRIYAPTPDWPKPAGMLVGNKMQVHCLLVTLTFGYNAYALSNFPAWVHFDIPACLKSVSLALPRSQGKCSTQAAFIAIWIHTCKRHERPLQI